LYIYRGIYRVSIDDTPNFVQNGPPLTVPRVKTRKHALQKNRHRSQDACIDGIIVTHWIATISKDDATLGADAHPTDAVSSPTMMSDTLRGG